MDLPNIRKKPSYDAILRALQALQTQPKSWSNFFDAEKPSASDQATIQRFLMSIVASDLEWLQESHESGGDALAAQEQREILFDLASRRISERCGRTAMPEMTRTWVVPASVDLPEIRFEIREPPLIGDNLGLKTWGTSYVIAKKLEKFGIQFLDHLFTNSRLAPAGYSNRLLLPDRKVLELGAGTGLVGVSAGALWGADVHLTDLAEIADNLLFNIEKNAFTVKQFGGNISGGVLDWKEPDKAQEVMVCKRFDIILAADPLYDDEHPALLANVIHSFLKNGGESRALVAIPMRDKTTRSLSEKLSKLLTENGFLADSSGEEACQDDWEPSSGPEVNIQWTFWKRMPLRS